MANANRTTPQADGTTPHTQEKAKKSRRIPMKRRGSLSHVPPQDVRHLALPAAEHMPSPASLDLLERLLADMRVHVFDVGSDNGGAE